MSHISGKFNLIKINDLENFFNSGIFQHDSINKKGNKINEKNKYIYFIEVLKKKLYLEQDDYIIPFFLEKNIFIPEIIMNGYIEHELNNQENSNIISLLNKFFPFMMHKKYFFFLYKKFSKILRGLGPGNDLKEIDIIKFYKVFNLFKLFFSYDDIIKLNKKYIYFFGDNNISINIHNVSNNYMLTTINIFIYKSPLFSILNKNKNNFSLIKLYQKDKKGNKNEIINIKYKDIIKPDIENNIKEIKFIINENKISYVINNENNTKEFFITKGKLIFNKIKLLDNFNGKISNIEIIRKYKNNIENKIEIIPGINSINIDINNSNKIIIQENIEIKIKNNNKNIFYKNYPDILYENIKYYGGFESFIPILKIFYNLFSFFSQKDKDDKNNFNKLKDLYKSFFKIIFNLINFSELNLNNFFDIIIPFIASLSEINEVINNPEIKNEIYKDNNLFNLFCLISISSCSLSVKKIFRTLFEIDVNKINFVSLDYKNNEKILLKYNSTLDWYIFMIFIKIEFIILVTNDINKIQKGFFSILLNIYNSLDNDINIIKNIDEKNKTKIKAMIQLFFAILNYLNENFVKLPDNFIKIKDCDLLNFISNFPSNEENLILVLIQIMKYLLILNKTELIKFGGNNKDNSDECFYSKFYILFLSLKGVFHKKNNFNEDIKKKFKDIMKFFPENKSLILEILDENEEINFIKKEEIIMEEFIDFHGKYRHLIKELFLFNRPWSNEKLFFYLKQELKYKNINYYTNNFQRPILYPMLDYVNQYPNFSYFKIDNNFYLKENFKKNILTNEYNFNFNCKALDELTNENNKELIINIPKKFVENIQVYDACLIKRTHYVKGKIFIIMINGLPKKIYFYSFLNNENLNDKLCNGAIFKCPLKDMGRIICIELKDIRLIMRRIYFYEKSGIEIFTRNKSYYFNFSEEKNSETIINLLVYYSFSQNELYPININGNIIGYSKILFNKENIKENDLIFIKNKYINELINHWKKIDKNNNKEEFLSCFDALIYLNLLSNRSYNDIYQYPIFPLLFFYDTTNHNKIERDLENHIGFQTSTKLSEKRKKEIIEAFNSKKEEIENGLINEETAFYFESNFSNINYICNYLIRVFPFSFISIELHGDGFDTKNLFNSIEDTFYSISYKENDLRELIPEFFYFPEIFLNINKLNFYKNDNDVNDVKMPEEFFDKINNKDNNNNFYFHCKFIANMRETIEKNYTKILKWKDLIFGDKQKYLEDNNLLFKPEAYISFDDNNIIKIKESLNNIEFGLLPNQIIYKEDKKDINLNQIFMHDKKDNNLIYIKNKINHYENVINIMNNEIINFYYNDIIIIIDRKIPKIDILIEGKLYKEFYENITSINYFHFNKRLNMFIISSTDGLLLLYILPGKLINIIKHPIKNNFFDFAFLSSNPFPNIIAFDKKEKCFYSFSINGFFINKISLYDLDNFNLNENDNINIRPIFDDENGIYKDIILIQINKSENIDLKKLKEKNSYFLDVPFFEKVNINDICFYK